MAANLAAMRNMYIRIGFSQQAADTLVDANA
jgi:hypothetical protein